jgi:hypothetical protein
MNPGSLLNHQCFKRCDQSSSFDFANSHFDGNPGLSNPLNSLTGDMRCRVLATDDDSPKASRNDSISTWRRLAEMTAGFQGDIQVGPTSRLTGLPNGVDLRVSFPELLMITVGNQIPVCIHDHRTDQGIWFHIGQS